MNPWHHSPQHRLKSTGAYIITGSTYCKQHLFSSPAALDLLQNSLIEMVMHYRFEIRAWALFPNHYHLILLTFHDSKPLQSFITQFHSQSSRKLNALEQSPGRKVWFQFWDTRLTYRTSYLARLNYVMENPVRHGVIAQAELYPWCSAKWFKNHSDPGHFKTVKSFKTDNLAIIDDF